MLAERRMQPHKSLAASPSSALAVIAALLQMTATEPGRRAVIRVIAASPSVLARLMQFIEVQFLVSVLGNVATGTARFDRLHA